MTDIAEPPIDVAVDVRGITRAGEVSCGPGIDQDVATWNTQQQGLPSRGSRGESSPSQERRIQFGHDNLERYLAMGPFDA